MSLYNSIILIRKFIRNFYFMHLEQAFANLNIISCKPRSLCTTIKHHTVCFASPNIIQFDEAINRQISTFLQDSSISFVNQIPSCSCIYLSINYRINEHDIKFTSLSCWYNVIDLTISFRYVFRFNILNGTNTNLLTHPFLIKDIQDMLISRRICCKSHLTFRSCSY